MKGQAAGFRRHRIRRLLEKRQRLRGRFFIRSLFLDDARLLGILPAGAYRRQQSQKEREEMTHVHGPQNGL